MSVSKSKDWVELVDFWESFSSIDEDENTSVKHKAKGLNKSGYGAIFKQLNRSQTGEGETGESSLLMSLRPSRIVSASGAGDGGIIKALDEVPSSDIGDCDDSSSSPSITILTSTCDVGVSCSLSFDDISNCPPPAVPQLVHTKDRKTVSCVQDIDMKTGVNPVIKKRSRIMRFIHHVLRPRKKH